MLPGFKAIDGKKVLRKKGTEEFLDSKSSEKKGDGGIFGLKKQLLVTK